MAWDRKRLEEDLRGLLDGDVRFDPGFAALYACDAGIHQIQPLGVVRPRHLQDVVRCVEYAAEQQLPLHPRGAGSGVSGECLGGGVVLDFSRYFRRIEVAGDEVVVQPGAVLEHINRKLAENGRRVGPDPATESVSTAGGLVGRNASGSRFLAYGSMRDSVVSLQVVLADGSVIEVGPGAEPTSLEAVSGVEDLTGRLERVLSARGGQAIGVAEHVPASLRPGYSIGGTGPFGSRDLADLIVGSEGTLGLVTEIRLKTFPVPRANGVALLSFKRLRDAAAAVSRVREYPITACDLLDRRLLSLAREAAAELSHWVEPDAEALLLVEATGREHGEVRDSLERMVRRGIKRDLLAGPPRMTLEASEVKVAWQLAKSVVPRLLRLRGKSRPIPFMEDAWVPPEKLPLLIEQAQKVLREVGVVASVYAHAAHGELHLRPLLDLSDPDHQRLLPSLAEAYFDRVVELGGMISVEHAWGLSRAWYLRHRFTQWHAYLCEIKRVFDPQRILNPGRLGDPHPASLAEHLRRVTAGSPHRGDDSTAGAEEVLPVWTPHLAESADELLAQTRQCNGCARCRVEADTWRMCPLFHGHPREEASPRAKANLVRAVLTGELPPESLSSDDLKKIADLCFHCHQCRVECPTEVDIPLIVAEWKAAFVADNGMRLREWWLARPERFAQWGQRWVGLANFVLRNPQARWLLERFTGIAAGRKLPRLSPVPFLKTAQRQRLGMVDRGAKRKVAYFVDVYANWFDTELAQATVAVLRHNGFSVLVPGGQQPAGMPLLVAGGADASRREAARNVSQLAELVRLGYRIVTTEPSAALCLTHDYPALLSDDEEARLVAENTSDVGSLLWQEHLQGRLELDFRPVNMQLVYHAPCHLRALRDGVPGVRLLRLIPGLRVVDAPEGCSGMAGMYGVRREHYRSSLRIGWELIESVRAHGIQGGTTECSACKLQMEQGGNKATVHPLKILAWAYQAMHFDDNPLLRVSEPLTVT